MDTNLLKIRHLKYRALGELLGLSVTVPSLSAVRETVLEELIPNWAGSFTLDTSEGDIAIGIGKHSVLNLRFVASRSDLLSESITAKLELLRELGLFNDERKKDSLELGWTDPTGAQDVADTVTDANVFFVVTLTSKDAMENMREFASEVAAELSTGVSTESAVDNVLRRRIENAAKQFPRTFTVEEAFLANSDSIHLQKSFYM